MVNMLELGRKVSYRDLVPDEYCWAEAFPQTSSLHPRVLCA